LSAPDPAHLTLVEELRALAGVSPDTNTFNIVHDGRGVHVQFSPGSTDSLSVTTRVPDASSEKRIVSAGYRDATARPLIVARPLGVTLRWENGSDHYAKEAGVNRELQTGDLDFDRRVFIDTIASDDAVRALLASPDARSAIIALLSEKCSSLTIDDEYGNIALSLFEFTTRAPPQGRGARIVAALATLAASLPPVLASGEAPPVNTQKRAAKTGCGLAFAGFILTPIAAIGLAPDHCVESDDEGSNLVCSAGPECCMPLLSGLAVGLLASLPVVVAIQRLVRGQSDSSENRLTLTIAAVGLFIELGIIIARLAG